MSVPGRPEETGPRAGETSVPGGPEVTGPRTGGDYAEAVDPWATAEADAIARDGHVPFHLSDPAQRSATWTMPGAEPATTALAPADRARKGVRKLVAAVAAGAVALTVTTAVILWPDFPALDFHQLDEESRHEPAVEISSLWSDAEVVGERAYFANTGAGGVLGVVAIDTESRAEVWRTTLTEPGVTGWDTLLATPDELVLRSTPAVSSRITMVVLDARDAGRKLWDRQIGSTDVVHLGEKSVLLADRGESRLLWLDTRTGKVRHEEDDPGSSALVAVTTAEDLHGPSATLGRLLDARAGDSRIVQIKGDDTVRLLDLDSGKELRSWPAVVSTSSDVLAHAGRLFAEDTTGSADRVFGYSLDEPGEPVTLYTAPADAQLSTFAPCGEERLCFVQTDGYDRVKDQVVAVDAVNGGKLWSRPLAEVEALTPVGDSVLVSTSAGTDDVTLLDAKGAVVWTAPGRAARLDGGNVLRFADPLTAAKGNRTISGAHLGDESVPMGEVRDVYTGSCSWNTSVLACVGEKQLLLYRFSGGR